MIKKCVLCGNEFNTKNARQTICNNNHILKCTNCNKDIIVTSSDWYKKNMYLTKHIIFCDNKCSIQYNKLQNSMKDITLILTRLKNYTKILQLL